MITVEEWTTIRCLYNKGHSKSEIARRLNINRKTVARAIKKPVLPQYQRQEPAPSILDEYLPDIQHMLYIDHFIGSRILSELRKKGYSGGRTTFYDYLSKINGKKNIQKISMPYETPPAKQCQFDWSPYKVNLNGKVITIYIFSTILSYSRKRKYVVSFAQDQESMLYSLEEAFKDFDGVPEEILVDNAHQMVDNANPLDFKWNEKFLSFCGFYGITPRACKVRTPKTKGKVENPFYYLEQHFIKGSFFKDFNDLKEKLEVFNHHVNTKEHSTTKEIPNQRFDELEKKYLNTLPDNPFTGILTEHRKVNWDLLISYQGNKYSVPYPYAGKSVWVQKVLGKTIQIYSDKGQLIAQHALNDRKGNIIKQTDHYSGIAKEVPKDLDLLKHEFKDHFPEYIDFLKQLCSHDRNHPGRELRKIIALRHYYTDEDIKEALSLCIEWKRYDAKILSYLLRSRKQVAKEKIIVFHLNKDIYNEQTDIKPKLLDYEILC